MEELLSASGVVKVCQDSRNSLMLKFGNDRRIVHVEVNDVVVRPRMIGNSGAFGCCLHISNMFFFLVAKDLPATEDFVDNIRL